MTLTVAETMADSTLGLELRLLLARLLVPSKRPPAKVVVRKALAKALDFEPSTETLQDWVDLLCAEGLIGKNLKLTEKGRRHALDILGATNIRPRTRWATILTRYFVAPALGIDPSELNTIKKLTQEETLASAILKRHHGIDASVKNTLVAVLEAVVCQELGYDVVTFKDLKKRKIAELLKAQDKSIPQEPKQQARVLLDTNGIDGLRALVLTQKTTKASARDRKAKTVESNDTFDLDAFARTVLALARNCPTGWYGENKVFINHVYKHLDGESAFVGMTISDFKQKLVEANRTDRLSLSRADLVSAMDPEDVRQSETRQFEAVYHFILVGEERP